MNDDVPELPHELRAYLEAADELDEPTQATLTRLEASLPLQAPTPVRPIVPWLVAAAVVVSGLSYLALEGPPSPGNSPLPRPSPPIAAPTPVAAPPAVEIAVDAGAPPARVESPRPNDIAEEARFLESARNRLRSDPAEARAMADRHRTLFPRGALTEERELIAIDALVRLGRRDAAARRAERFLRSFPRSIHRSRIEALVAQ